MSAHKNIDKICMAIVAVTLAAAILFCSGQALGIKTTAYAVEYVNRIFDSSKVHTFDIVINDWDSFLETCESEEYSPCNVVIDGEAIKNVGIRGKGNTSLSSVRNMGSSRYSFKIEFDRYDSAKSYHGLDKLCLNNIIQDNTYMKDYLSYTLMENFGVDAPLCSYVYITVNGEDWGLYLAVEAIEESFLKRNYGSNFGELYKPDSMSFGGGRGNGMDFNMGDFFNEEDDSSANSDSDETTDFENGKAFGFGKGEMPDFRKDNMPEFDADNLPDGFEPPQMPGKGENMHDAPDGMGSDDVKLKYIDDNADSYSNIFNNAKTNVTEADKKRLISSLKSLSEMNNIESTVNIEEVIRYFVVHNFLCNGDSYTGQMIHNYYLYEKNGQLSMIPWDYNLAFGTFHGMDASSSVNSAIDTPVSGDMSDRPMIAWIFESEEYTNRYHELFSKFISETDFESLIDETAALIDEYVRKDPTKFCTYEEYQTGVTAIGKFCGLRSESAAGQLSGAIPATTDGQKTDSSALIDASSLNISDMGTMNMGKGGDFGGFGRNNDGSQIDPGTINESNTKMLNAGNMPGGFGGNTPPDFNGDMPEDFDGNTLPDFNGDMPEGFDGNMPPDFNGDMSEGFDGNTPPDFNGDMPKDFDGNMPGEFSRPDSENKYSDSNEQETTKSTKSDMQNKSTESNNQGTTESKLAEPDMQNKNWDEKKDIGSKSGEPFMDRAAPTNGNPTASNTTTLILLGISSSFLVIGIAYALKFKR